VGFETVEGAAVGGEGGAEDINGGSVCLTEFGKSVCLSFSLGLGFKPFTGFAVPPSIDGKEGEGEDCEFWFRLDPPFDEPAVAFAVGLDTGVASAGVAPSPGLFPTLLPVGPGIAGEGLRGGSEVDWGRGNAGWAVGIVGLLTIEVEAGVWFVLFVLSTFCCPEADEPRVAGVLIVGVVDPGPIKDGIAGADVFGALLVAVLLFALDSADVPETVNKVEFDFSFPSLLVRAGSVVRWNCSLSIAFAARFSKGSLWSCWVSP